MIGWEYSGFCTLQSKPPQIAIQTAQGTSNVFLTKPGNLTEMNIVARAYINGPSGVREPQSPATPISGLGSFQGDVQIVTDHAAKVVNCCLKATKADLPYVSTLPPIKYPLDQVIQPVLQSFGKTSVNRLVAVLEDTGRWPMLTLTPAYLRTFEPHVGLRPEGYAEGFEGVSGFVGVRRAEGQF